MASNVPNGILIDARFRFGEHVWIYSGWSKSASVSITVQNRKKDEKLRHSVLAEKYFIEECFPELLYDTKGSNSNSKTLG